jgi:hypothetical protein
MVKFRELELNRFLTTFHPSILHGGCWFNNVSWESHANLLLSQHSLVVCSLEIHLFWYSSWRLPWMIGFFSIHSVLHNTYIYGLSATQVSNNAFLQCVSVWICLSFFNWVDWSFPPSFVLMFLSVVSFFFFFHIFYVKILEKFNKKLAKLLEFKIEKKLQFLPNFFVKK